MGWLMIVENGCQMNDVIGQILPSAVGIAVSPIPIIAVILMMMSPRSKVNSASFLFGWVLGILSVTTLVTFLAPHLNIGSGSGSNPTTGWILIGLGVVLVYLAIQQFRQRPRDGQDPVTPKWMASIDSFTAVGSFGLGYFLGSINPKNLILGVSGGMAIGGSALGWGDKWLTIAAMVLIASLSVAVPVALYWMMPAKFKAPLDHLRAWLTNYNAIIMTVLLGLLAVSSFSNGIRAF